MVLHCKGEYQPKRNNIDFESAREILVKADDKVVVKRRFERINNMIACKSYIKFEDTTEKKKIFCLWTQTY